MIVEKEKKREEYEEQIKALRLKISELEKSKEDINKRKNSLLQELTKCQAEEKQRVDEKNPYVSSFQTILMSRKIINPLLKRQNLRKTY